MTQVLQEKTIPAKTMNEPEKLSILRRKREALLEHEQKLKEISQEINDLKEKLQNARSDFDIQNVHDKLVVNGSLQVTGTTFVDNLVVDMINDEKYDNLLMNTLKYDSPDYN